MKKFYIQTNIGKAKYVVNHSDGSKTHKDGSEFFDIRIFNDKKKLQNFISELKHNGYMEK